MDDNKFLAIMGKLSEIGERTARTETQISTLSGEVEKIKEEDKEQNRLLAEHIQGTVANTERLNIEIEARKALQFTVESVHSRVEKLERLPKVIKFLKDNILWLALVASGIGAILILFKH